MGMGTPPSATGRRRTISGWSPRARPFPMPGSTASAASTATGPSWARSFSVITCRRASFLGGSVKYRDGDPFAFIDAFQRARPVDPDLPDDQGRGRALQEGRAQGGLHLGFQLQARLRYLPLRQERPAGMLRVQPARFRRRIVGNVFSGGARLANELQLPRSLRLGVALGTNLARRRVAPEAAGSTEVVLGCLSTVGCAQRSASCSYFTGLLSGFSGGAGDAETREGQDLQPLGRDVPVLQRRHCAVVGLCAQGFFDFLRVGLMLLDMRRFDLLLIQLVGLVDLSYRPVAAAAGVLLIDDLQDSSRRARSLSDFSVFRWSFHCLLAVIFDVMDDCHGW